MLMRRADKEPSTEEMKKVLSQCLSSEEARMTFNSSPDACDRRQHLQKAATGHRMSRPVFGSSPLKCAHPAHYMYMNKLVLSFCTPRRKCLALLMFVTLDTK